MKKLDVFALAVVGVLAGPLVAQRGAAANPSMATAPVGIPAQIGDPLLRIGGEQLGQLVGAGGNRTKQKQIAAAPPAETHGPQLVGSDLKAAVKKVTALPWHSRLPAALAEARHDDKPVLLLQTLGELDGYA